MRMTDTNYNQIKVGQEVHFGISQNHWDGEVIDVSEVNEQILVKVTKRTTGVGLIERFNRIECSRYITVTKEPKVDKVISHSTIDTAKFILISIEYPDDYVVTWYDLFEFKNKQYPDLDFVEIHPSKDNLVDNANVRHLWHLKEVQLPCLRELENIKEYKVLP